MSPSSLLDLQVHLSAASVAVMDLLEKMTFADPDMHVRKFAASSLARWAHKLTEISGNGPFG